MLFFPVKHSGSGFHSRGRRNTQMNLVFPSTLLSCSVCPCTLHKRTEHSQGFLICEIKPSLIQCTFESSSLSWECMLHNYIKCNFHKRWGCVFHWILFVIFFIEICLKETGTNSWKLTFGTTVTTYDAQIQACGIWLASYVLWRHERFLTYTFLAFTICFQGFYQFVRRLKQTYCSW